jgi:hypothetical protein
MWWLFHAGPAYLPSGSIGSNDESNNRIENVVSLRARRTSQEQVSDPPNQR